MEDVAETWHTCLGHYPLQKICFISVREEFWLLLQLKVSIDLYWEKWKLTISAKSLGIFDFYFYKNVY